MGTKSAARSARQAERRRVRTQAARSEVKTSVSQARRLLADGDATAPQAAGQAIQTLDRASAKNIIHRNKAARLKSRLAKMAAQEPGAK